MEPSRTRGGRASSGLDESEWAPTPGRSDASRDRRDGSDAIPRSEAAPASEEVFSAPPTADRTPAWGTGNGARPYPLAAPPQSARDRRGEQQLDIAGAASLFADQSNPFDPTDPDAQLPTRMPAKSARRLEALGQRMDLIAISPDREVPESPNPSGAIEVFVDPGAIQADLWDPAPPPPSPAGGTVTIADLRHDDATGRSGDDIDVWSPVTEFGAAATVAGVGGNIGSARGTAAGTTFDDDVDRANVRRASQVDDRAGFTFNSESDGSDRPMVRGGPRWYRKQIRNFGVIAGLIPMFLLGAGAWLILAVSSATLSGTIGLILGTSAAPGLLVAGAPFGSSSAYPIAALCSIPLWLLLGWWATRRTLAEPMPNWHDYFVNLAWLTGAVVLGATIAIIASSVYLDQPLLA